MIEKSDEKKDDLRLKGVVSRVKVVQLELEHSQFKQH